MSTTTASYTHQAPRPGVDEIRREGLLEALASPAASHLVVLSAPAGFGKTVLAAQWCRERSQHFVIWRSVSNASHCAETLLAALLDAVEQGTGRTAPAAFSWLNGADGHLSAGGFEQLSGLLSDTPPMIVVCDGLGSASPPALLADLARALTKARRCGIQLLISVRAQISTSVITKLMHRGRALTLDEQALRFGAHEIREALTTHRFANADLSYLEQHLEGWPLGVHQAAKHWPDVAPKRRTRAEAAANTAMPALIRVFFDDVLATASLHQRLFLLCVAPLEEVNAGLGAAIAEPAIDLASASATLNALCAGGFFTSVSKRGTGWYRLHPALRHVLDQQLRKDAPTAREHTLRRAAAWRQHHGMVIEAADCLVELKDWDGVAGTLASGLPQLFVNDDLARLNNVIAKVPPSILCERPEWITGAAYIAFENGHLKAGSDLLSFAERSLPPGSRVVASVLRASAASWLSDTTYCINEAEDALALCDELGENHEFADLYTVSRTGHQRAQARSAALEAGAYQNLWARVAQHDQPLDAQTALELPTLVLTRVEGRRALYHALSGRAAEAEAEARAVLTIAEEATLSANRGMATTFLALGEALRSKCRFGEALEALQRCAEHAASNRRVNLLAVATAARCHIHLANAQPERALREVAEFQRAYPQKLPPVPYSLLVTAEARAQLSLGNQEEAEALLRQAPNTSWVASSRVSIALAVNDYRAAQAALEAWPDEITVISGLRKDLAGAAAFEATRGNHQAARLFDRVLETAAEHQLVEPIVEYGPLLLRLLRRAAARGGPSGAIAATAQKIIGAPSATSLNLTPQQTLVMIQLPREISLPELAEELLLSPNTVRSHVKEIYRKLGVSSRQEAVAAWQANQSDRA